MQFTLDFKKTSFRKIDTFSPRSDVCDVCEQIVFIVIVLLHQNKFYLSQQNEKYFY